MDFHKQLYAAFFQQWPKQ